MTADIVETLGVTFGVTENMIGVTRRRAARPRPALLHQPLVCPLREGTPGVLSTSPGEVRRAAETKHTAKRNAIYG